MHLDPDSLNLPDGMDVTPPVCVAEAAKVSCGGGGKRRRCVVSVNYLTLATAQREPGRYVNY